MVKILDVCKFLNEKRIDFDYVGKEDFVFERYSPLKAVTDSSITWVKKKDVSLPWKEGEHKDLLVVAPYGFVGNVSDANFLYCDAPKAVFFEILGNFFQEKKGAYIDTSSVVRTDRIGKNVSIGCHCYICEDVVIGDNVEIGNNVSIECPTKIGDDSIIHSGVVIGTDGFGYYQEDGVMRKVPHFGGVVIGERVEIGANTCIDRGTMEDTVIGDDTKIDNLCHIAHNVQIGKDVMIVAGSNLCGSCRIGDGSYIAPGATIKNQLEVGKGAFVGMQTVAIKNVPDGESIFGVPGRGFKRDYST